MSNPEDWIRIEGGSMRPLIESGDWARIDWEAREPTPGEIALAQDRDGTWVIHRVVGNTSTRLTLKGDASKVSEELALDHIWGTVSAIRAPNGREKLIRTNWIDTLIALLSRHNARALVKLLAGWKRWTS